VPYVRRGGSPESKTLVQPPFQPRASGRRANDGFGTNELYQIPAELCNEWAEAATRQVRAAA